jgi:hypothetical protein
MSSIINNTDNYQEAERDLIKKLTDYDKIEEIMDHFFVNSIKRAVKKYKTPIISLDDLETALKDLEDDDYCNYFDKLFIEIVVNNCSPDAILNDEQYNILIDYTFAIKHKEKNIPTKRFLSQNQEELQKYRKWVSKEQKKNGNQCCIC